MIFRFFGAMACLLLLAACEQPVTESGIPRISSAQTDAIQTRHVDNINAFRAERGQPPLTLSASLTAAARTHALDMSVQERAWHFGSDGTSPKDRAVRAGFPGRVLGENISESFDNDIDVFQSWLEEPFTREVMLDSRANAVGFGWHQEDNGKLWWVQVVGQTGVAAPAPQNVFTPGS